MIKKLSVLALAGLFALPSAASAASNAELSAKIEQLTRELAEMRDQLEEQEEAFSDLDESAEGWNLASRIQISGDIRSRMDVHYLETADHYQATDVAAGAAEFINIGSAMGQTATLAAFGLTTADSLGTMLTNLQPLILAGETVFVTNLSGALQAGGATAADANRMAQNSWYLFTDAGVGTVLGNMAAGGATVGDLLGGLSTFQNITTFLKSVPAASRKAVFDQLTGGIYAPTLSQEYENETSFSTRMRMNMRVKATENIEVKARAVAYKFWGMQSNPNGETDEYGVHVTDANPYFLNSRSFDGTVGRQPKDSAIVLDRAFMNWNNIAGLPMWFSIGRRPTTDGPPAQLRMGADKRMATPVNYMDYPFDGISIGYAYWNLFGLTDGPGRIRFCYGRGFEAGSSIEDTGNNDVDFAGLSWDVYKKGSRFMNIQSFGAFNIFNVPGDTYFPSPYEQAALDAGWTDAQLAAQGMNNNGFLDRKNMGNIFHTAAVYMDEVANLNYFVTLGWSHTDPNDDVDEMGISLLSDSWDEPEEQDGYGVYVGARYDLDDLGLKFGLEYNWGSEYWLAFTPGHDDVYSSKLQTRGDVWEVYMIYDLPGGEAVSKFGKAFMRLGYQHYDYDYTYSGMWLGTPQKIDELDEDPMYAQFYAPAESMDQVYLTLEAYF